MIVHNYFGVLNNFQERKLKKRLETFRDFNKLNFWLCDFIKEHNIEPCPIRLTQINGEYNIEFLSRQISGKRRYSV